MTYIIAEPCVDLKDGACVDVCPVDCIYTTDDDNQFYIHPEECSVGEACGLAHVEVLEAVPVHVPHGEPVTHGEGVPHPHRDVQTSQPVVGAEAVPR